MKRTRGKTRSPHEFHADAGGVSADDIRANLRRVRREKQLSAQVVSSRMGISRPFYTQLEGGRRRMSLEYFLGIAKALNEKPEIFLRLDPGTKGTGRKSG